MLTQTRLRELLDYDPVTGVFKWRQLGIGKKHNWTAGTTTVQGYKLYTVEGERLRGARLAWLYMTGEWPPEHVDHINGNTADDRWCNLRLATRNENMANTKLLRLNNTSGARGVSWNKRRGKWHARVNYDRTLFHCGYFDSFEEAVKARDARAAQIHGEFAQLNTLQ